MVATANAREVIGEATLGELEGTLRGRLVRPSDPDYDQARLVWNAAHDRRPALIIRCAGTADVMRAVEFARSEGLQLAVRSGAHSVAGFSTCDGGVVIDISSMKGIRVDPIARRAVVQAGLTWAEFDHETQAFGLAVTGGLVSSTGIAGFTLGGLLTTLDSEVLHVSLDPIPGLFAAGRATSGLAAWGYASGVSLGDGSFYGRRAGRSAAKG